MQDKYFKSYYISEEKRDSFKGLTGEEIAKLSQKHNVSESLIKKVIGMRRKVTKAFLPILSDIEVLALLKEDYKNKSSNII